MVSPVEFIPVAEQIGLIKDIGEWVLHEACREAMLWPDGLTVAVNASPLQMEAPGLRRLRRARAETDRPARAAGWKSKSPKTWCCINEAVVINGHARGNCGRIGRPRWCWMISAPAIASLSQLARFHFDKIKIDRSFISAPDTTPDHATIVRAIAALRPEPRRADHGRGRGDRRSNSNRCAPKLDAPACKAIYFSRPAARRRPAGPVRKMEHAARVR